uniref:Uncharacterized protein n=1 Tax=Romanomermis culicivorax TaxID=13658 RepID=A0A915KLY6_ROMCU
MGRYDDFEGELGLRAFYKKQIIDSQSPTLTDSDYRTTSAAFFNESIIVPEALRNFTIDLMGARPDLPLHSHEQNGDD